MPKGYTDNAILNMCAVKSICYYLTASNTITIKSSAYIEIKEKRLQGFYLAAFFVEHTENLKVFKYYVSESNAENPWIFVHP